MEYDINASSAATVYVQIHDWPNPVDLAKNLIVPANGAVPVKSWPAAQGSVDNYKEFKNGELMCKNGIFVCVSTTQATLTLGTGNNRFASVATETWQRDVTTSTQSSLQGVANLQVWSEAVGNVNDIKLIRAVCTNLEAGVRYLQLFTRNTSFVPNGTAAIQQWTLNATGDAGGLDTISLNFGFGVDGNPLGLYVRSQDTGLVNRQGCNLFLSTTVNTLTVVTGAGGNFYAEYL